MNEVEQIRALVANLERWQAARERITARPGQTKVLGVQPLKQAVIYLRELIQLKEQAGD